MLGFPNNNFFPAFIKMGWQHLLNAQLISLPCRITSFLEMTLKIPFLNIIDKLMGIFWYKIYSLVKQCDNITITSSNSFPFSEYEQINRSQKLTFNKTPEILKWKLDSNPFNNFRYYVARKGNIITSYLIVEERGMSHRNGIRWCRIIDWCHLSEDLETLTCSYAKILLIIKQTADLISLWIPTENCYRDVFKKLGFIRIGKFFPENPVILRVLTDDVKVNRVIKDKSSWQPKLIETDTLL